MGRELDARGSKTIQNVNLSGYRDAGNSPASDDKRATAWQDRVALKI
jgi:hypothetical protein